MTTATTTDRRVLRIPRSPPSPEEPEERGDYILLYICSDHGGSSDLDLKLIATEGNSPYVGSVRGNQLSRLRAKNYHGSDEEWEQILSLILLRKSPQGQDATGVQELEVFASVADEELTITIRKNIGGITQRLGTISLREDESQEIELFDWTGLAAQSAIVAEDQKKSLESQLQARGEAIKQLNKQLEALTKAKEEHENALLEKFSQLLNSKKLKIRDQQRLLSDSKVDSNKEVQATRNTGRSRKAAPSRARKRKAEMDDLPDPAKESNVDKMEVDGMADGDEATADESTSPRNTPTPEPSDQETADDESERQETPPPAPSGVKGKLFESADAKKHAPPATASPPPRRELPFEKSSPNRGPPERVLLAVGAQHETQKDDVDQSAGETDDDEL